MDSLQNTSKQIKTIFLLEFTKQLILNSRKYEEKINEDILKGKIKEIIKKRNEGVIEQAKFKQNIISQPRPRIIFKAVPGIKMPRIAPFPATVKDVRPVPIPKELNLKKLNLLIKDPTVNSIIIDGPDRNVQVRRGDEKRVTPIILTLEEIKETINTFSQESRIPIEDVYKVVVGNLMLSAINPRGEIPKIIITKIAQSYVPRPKY